MLETQFEESVRLYYNQENNLLKNNISIFDTKYRNTPVAALAQAHTHYFKGLHALILKDFPNAQQQIQQAIVRYQGLKQFGYLSAAHTAYAVVAHTLNRDSLECVSYQYALAAARAGNDSVRIAKSWNNLAQWFAPKANGQDSAQKYYRLATKYTLLHGNNINKIQLLSNLANFFIVTTQYDSALRYVNRALVLVDSTGGLRQQYLNTYLTQADCYVKLHNPKKALAILYRIRKIIQPTDELDIQQQAMLVSLRAYQQLKIADSVYTFYENYLTISKEILEIEAQRNFNKLQVEYDVAKKDREQLELAASTQRKLLLLGGIALGFFLLAIFLWYRSRWLRQFAAQRHEAEVQRRIAAEQKEYATQIALENERVQKAAIQSNLYHAGELILNKNRTLFQLRDLLSENHHTNAQKLRTDIARLIEDIEKDIRADGTADAMFTHNTVDEMDFMGKLQRQYPQLTKNDLRVCAYIKLGFSSAEIATFLNISTNSVEMRRSRLRAKLNVPEGMKFIAFLETIS